MFFRFPLYAVRAGVHWTLETGEHGTPGEHLSSVHFVPYQSGERRTLFYVFIMCYINLANIDMLPSRTLLEQNRETKIEIVGNNSALGLLVVNGTRALHLEENTNGPTYKTESEEKMDVSTN